MKKLFFALLFVFPFAHAMDFSLEKDECIILVASTKSETEARAIANKYPGAQLYTSKSGYIAIGLEKISKQESAARIKELLNAEKIPKGSNCADGTRITGLLNVDGQKPEKQAKKKDAQPTATRGVRPEIFYRDLNNWEVGVCLGYISQEIKQKGRENIHKGHEKYFGKNIRFAKRGSEIIKSFPECNGKSVDHIIQCLDSKGISPDEIALILGVNTGLANTDVSDRTNMSLACLDL